MPALFFPNVNALRLALASGLVPRELACAPAAAGFDAHGRPWIEPAELPARESLAALARLGVQALGGAGVPTEPVGCWAELLPLRGSKEVHAGPFLFLVPDRLLAKFVARVRRVARVPVGVRLADGLAWVTTAGPPAGVLAEVAEPDSPVEAFAEQTPGVWVRVGWSHPLPEFLTVPDGHVLLIRPSRSVTLLLADIPVPEPDEFRLARQPTVPAPAPGPPAVPVRLHLAPRPMAGRESLWVFDAAHAPAFWDFCAAADERLARRLEAGVVGRGADTRLLVRGAGGKRPPAVPPFPGTGYTADPRVPGLFVPANRVLRPNVRGRDLGRVLGAGPGLVVWVEVDAAGTAVPHTAPAAVFRPVTELIAYEPPPVAPLVPARNPAEAFPLARFALQAEPEPWADAEPEETGDEAGGRAAGGPEGPGWLRRSFQKLTARLRSAGDAPVPVPPPVPPAAEPTRPEPGPAAKRVERKLASPDALLHGHDWASRRRELEARLFLELPRLGPADRATRWAELATAYGATGNPADAAVCWLNAVWESPAPPPNWAEHWFVAECRAAKLADRPATLDRWLSEPGRPGAGRVVAAYAACVGFGADPPAGFVAALPRVLGFLDLHFDDLPVRAAWLARLAVARICDGDALGLARWRDRVLARLADRGPGLDLDEPSFLRFHGTASGDRFQTAREWLVRAWEPARKWVQEHGGTGRLRWAGLDAETEATAAYGQFMFAWGLGCLGERTRAKDWAARARKAVARAAGPGVDPAAHAVLSDLFLLRVKDAQEGKAARPGLPADLQARTDALPYLARYAVDKLREHSRILEPLERVQAYQGQDLKEFWGGDLLGERLFVLAVRASPADRPAEAEALLEVCAATPATDTLPRVVLTLLGVAPWLAPPALVRVLDLLPEAVGWVEAWLAGGRWTDAERATRLPQYQARMLDAGFAAAATLDPPTARTVLGQLVRRLLAAGDGNRAALLASAGRAFRTLRRFGLRGEAEALVRFLDPGATGRGAVGPDRLGLAAGWFTAGDEDAGNRILNDAREALYLAGAADPRDGERRRAVLAVAYAEALGFAPPRIAHGRLEEIFQRLPRATPSGSTNRYFTLRSLQLIDAVVRSVVTDDFALGPAVRGWLDDDEFLIRGRVHRDLAAVLRDAGVG